MAKIGLALSGGGFRGTLFHLGAIRFLHDAGILRDVTHITAVSGGSILAAHLVLNWDRYNGTDQDFEKVSQEILNFVKLDVRNRILRRFPFVGIGAALRWAVRRPYDRRFSRTGLLEQYYQKHLYGATCLYELPVRPELHLLSTNLSEGCLCSFTRSGLIMQRRLPGDRVQFERIQAGLASVPLAVTASSAFPAFFPPLRLRAADIGASLAAFSQQTFTDGGVFDNLGIRAFRFIERCWSEQCRPTGADGREMEVEELGETAEAAPVPAQGRAETWENASPATREYARLPGGNEGGGSGIGMPGRELVRRANHHEGEEQTASLLGPPGPEHDPSHPQAVMLRNTGAPRRQSRSSGAEFDAVLVSDAGAKLATHHNAFGGGLVRTALRASDILMDRVWQLEKEIFSATPGFLFSPIHRVVELEDDPHALQPVVQRQVIGIRTDLDRFSPVEIRTLVQHGYCVMRQSCRSRQGLFGNALPDGKPWDPCPPSTPPASLPPGRPGRPPAEPTRLARELQQSAFRRIVGTLLDWRDGMTYLFLPLVIALVLAVPVLGIWSYVHISRDEKALRTVAESDPDQAKVIQLMREGPIRSVEGMPVRDVDHLEPPDYRGFVILSDGHIVDLRGQDSGVWSWMELGEGGLYQYRHFLVRKIAALGTDGHLRFQFTSKAGSFRFRCHNPNLHPVLKRMRLVPAAGTRTGEGPLYRLELDLDFSPIPVDSTVDVLVDGLLRNDPSGTISSGHPVPHTSYGNTRLTTMWLLLPEHRHPGRIELIAFPMRRPQEQHTVSPTRQFETKGGSVLGWQIIDPEPDTTYQAHWILD